METPWVNSTKMKEIISKQINIVNSSRVQITSTSPYYGKNKNFTEIKIDCRLSNHISSLCISDEGDEFNGKSLPETNGNPCDSPACIDIEQLSEMESEAEVNCTMNITEPTNDQQNFQTDGSNYSPKDSVLDTIDSSDSNEADEKHKVFNSRSIDEDMYEVDSHIVPVHDSPINKNENPCDSPTCIGIEQPSEMEPEAEVNCAMNITEPTNDQQNFQTDGSNYSPKDSVLDTNDPSESNEADEKYKVFNSKSIDEDIYEVDSLVVPVHDSPINKNENPCDSPVCIDIEQLSELEPEAEVNCAMNITEPTNDQQNFQTDGSNYSPKDSTFDTIDSSDSNEADEKHKVFSSKSIDEDMEDMYEDDSLVVPVHDSPINKTEGKDNQPSTSFDFVNIRVPVVVGEYKIDICLEEAVLFEEKFMQINAISNKVFLSNSKFVPTRFSGPLDNGMSKALKGNLFIEGYISQNIEYTAANQDLETEPFYTDGKVYSMTKKRPFSTIVEIDDFLHPPVFGAITQKTFDFFDPNNKEIPQIDTKLFNTVTYYPEEPYCRLIFSEIHEHTSLSDKVNENYSHTPIGSVQVNPIHKKKETNKKQLTQRTVLVTFVHLLQEQRVRVRYDST
ncbi:hypothetical protein ACIQD3_03535 [Peribacillus loiseleuriae]|uniref:DUF7852 domain-containing protein n=1 Tax=Peribacillus loiseleuriae TaxID=1679170 RepID=UPI0038245D7D